MTLGIGIWLLQREEGAQPRRLHNLICRPRGRSTRRRHAQHARVRRRFLRRCRRLSPIFSRTSDDSSIDLPRRDSNDQNQSVTTNTTLAQPPPPAPAHSPPPAYASAPRGYTPSLSGTTLVDGDRGDRMHRQRQRRRASTGVADAPELGRQAHMATTITGAGPGADTGGPSAAGSSYTRGRGIWRTIVGLWDKLAGRERLRVPQHDREGFEPIGARLAW